MAISATILLFIYHVFPRSSYGYTNNISSELKKINEDENLFSPLNNFELYYIENYFYGYKNFQFYGTVTEYAQNLLINKNSYDVSFMGNYLDVPMTEELPDHIKQAMKFSHIDRYSSRIAGTAEKPCVYLSHSTQKYYIHIYLSLDSGAVIGNIVPKR